MSHETQARGIALVEALVALCLLGVLSAALVGVVLGAQRQFWRAAQFTRALRAAADRLESARLLPVAGEFEHEGLREELRVGPDEVEGVLRAEVRVTWEVPEPGLVRLVTLLPAQVEGSPP